MSNCNVIDCRLNPNGLYLKLQHDGTGQEFELYSVKLSVEKFEHNVRLFPFGKHQNELKITGSFSSQHACNKIEVCEHLEVTIEDIEKKFGRKVKIINKEVSK